MSTSPARRIVSAEKSHPQIPGAKPCTELETRAGIWRYDANKTAKHFRPRPGTPPESATPKGSRSIPPDIVFLSPSTDATSCASNWPDFTSPGEEATLPAEELLLPRAWGITAGPNAITIRACEGSCWRRSTAATGARRSARAPTKATDRRFSRPLGAGRHGVLRPGAISPPLSQRRVHRVSWTLEPGALPAGRLNVVFQSLAGEQASAPCEMFANGFAGCGEIAENAPHRPTGVAVGPDGSLYVSDDVRGRIYRITYPGGATAGERAQDHLRVQSATAAAGDQSVLAGANPPEGLHPDAGAATATLPVAKGATREMVALGDRIYHGEAGGAACTGCHGCGPRRGTSLGPDLTDAKWLWSDGSYAGIAKQTIREGVPQPKQYRGPMPPMGGAQLTADQVSALAAYVSSISHQRTATPDSHSALPTELAIPGQKIPGHADHPFRVMATTIPG